MTITARRFRVPRASAPTLLLSMVIVLVLTVVSACGGSGDDGSGSDAGGDAAMSSASAGTSPQQIFADTGCADCHGAEGETAVGASGSALQGARLIIQQFQTRVRNGKGSAMPGYTAEQISDEQIRTIYDWLSGR